MKNEKGIKFSNQKFHFEPCATKSCFPQMRARAEKETAVSEDWLGVVRDEERNRWEYESRFPVLVWRIDEKLRESSPRRTASNETWKGEALKVRASFFPHWSLADLFYLFSIRSLEGLVLASRASNILCYLFGAERRVWG